MFRATCYMFRDSCYMLQSIPSWHSHVKSANQKNCHNFTSSDFFAILMDMTKIEQAGITWIDIKKPTKESIAAAEPIIKLHPIVKHELLVPAFRAKGRI